MSTCRRLLVLGAFALMAASGSAQTFNEPKFFVWGEPATGWPGTNPRMHRMIHVSVSDQAQVLGENGNQYFNPRTEPAKFARSVAQKIYRAIQGVDAPVAATNLAIVIQNFGEDHAANDLSADPILRNANTRFFRLTDNLFVQGEPPLDALDFPRPGDSARWYRHPFLENAGENGPLKQWFEAFVAEYRAIQQDPSGPHAIPFSGGLPLPDPARFYMDTEATICYAPNRNVVRILKQIIDNPSYRTKYWYTLPVPGYGVPLASLYETERQRQISASIANPWPATIESFAALDLSRDCYWSTNRELCLWWKTICDKVEAHVMRKSMWDVIDQHWPAAKYGNYDEMFVDGAMDNTGWMFNRDDSNPIWNDDDVLRKYVGNSNPQPTHRFPRGFIEPLLGGFFYHGRNGQYLVSPRWTGGNVDMPTLYGIPQEQNYDGGYRHQSQTNQYLPATAGFACESPNGFGAPCETPWEVTMRLCRHHAESIINSGSGQRNAVLVPWLEMAGTENNGNRWQWYRTENEVREMLAMLRAKNIAEGAFWVNYEADPTHRNAAWAETALVIDKVYAARVDSYAILRGTQLVPIPTYDPKRLEYTLLEHVPNTSIRRERAASVRSVPILDEEIEDLASSELRVDFVWPQELSYVSDQFQGSQVVQLHINVECSSSKPGTIGYVQIWAPDASGEYGWQYASSIESDANSIPAYLFHAPVDTVSPFVYRTRRSFMYPFDQSRFIDAGALKTRLRLIHKGTNGAFTSAYDLVQVIPGTRVYNSPPPEGGQQQAGMRSDMNLDGLSDSRDVMQFVGDWLEGFGNADLDQDGEVDASDLDSFEAAYVAGT